GLEGQRIFYVRERDNLTLDGLSTGCGAPGQLRTGQGFDPGVYHIDMRNAAVPATPFAEFLVARFDTPLRVLSHGPVVGMLHLRRTDQPRSHHIEQFVRKLRLL